MSDQTTTVETGILFCANHPQTETSLRCNRCEKPICVKCAVATPTGYRCRECVRGQQKIFDNTEWYDFPLSMFIAVVIAGVGSFLVSFIGWFSFLIAPVIGVVIAEAVRLAVRKRRSRRLHILTAIAAAVGCLPRLVISLLFLDIWGLVFALIVLVLVTGTTYQRLSGINLFS